MAARLDEQHRIIRLLKVHPDFGLNYKDGDPGEVGLEWLEIGTKNHRRAEQRPDGKFTILDGTGKFLLPFLTKNYQSVDELVERLVSERNGILTDLRRPLGFIDNVEDACRLMDGKKVVIEHQHRWTMLMAPRVGGRHGNFWFVDNDVFNAMKGTRLIQRTSIRAYSRYYPEVYKPGPKTFNEYHQLRYYEAPRTKADVTFVDGQDGWYYPEGLLSPTRYKKKSPNYWKDLEAVKRQLSVVQEELDCVREELKATRAKLERSGRSLEFQQTSSELQPLSTIPARGTIKAIGSKRRKKPAPLSDVVGLDDAGKPITGLDLEGEFRKKAPKGLPPDLLPSADPDVSDDEWEKLMLIEQIKFRRRTGQ